MNEEVKVEPVEPIAVIGFKGNVIDGIILHPDNEHLIYPMGSIIIIRHIISRSQSFLKGHDNDLSVIALSKSGKYLASGQKTHMGFQADVIIWDFDKRSLIHRFKLHKVLIQSLSFSFNELYLASLGGQDDKRIVVWDVQTGKALCGNSSGADHVYQLRFYNKRDDMFVTVQDLGVKVWKVDYINKKIESTSCTIRNVKRQITNVIVDPSDSFVYCTTKTGDILEISLETLLFKRLGPIKKLFSQGILCITQILNGDLLIGAGDGTIAKINIKDMTIKSEVKVFGEVTSLSLTSDGTNMFVGTGSSNIYFCDTVGLKPELRMTCHYDNINTIAFPAGYSDVFLTSSFAEIRIWNAKNRQELLRIQVPNVDCYSAAFMPDGKSIVSGWSDGKIRAFLPQSGKLLYSINDSHNHGCTTLACTSDSAKIVSGGMEGEVRVWKIGPLTQNMECSLKEHRARVNEVKINKTNEQAVTSSSDGSCIIWDIVNHTRIICLFEATMFQSAIYHPEEYHVITTGSNRNVTYWDRIDGQAIRMLSGSEEGEVNTLSIFNNGKYFISAGEDKKLKIWKYDEGIIHYIGIGHAGIIRKIAIAPNQETIVSVGSEGAIFIWKVPEKVLHAEEEAK